MLGTAARVGAILGLTWDRVDFERRAINLRLPDAQTKKGGAVIAMNGMTRPALQTARHTALSDHVVEYASGPVKNIRKGFKSTCERAGLREVTTQTLRHTAAVHMVSAGISIEKVSQYLGHSNTRIT
ncbi:MAG: tyrosine-type recombinase/integrase [Pseudomonadota bacterium]